MKTHVFRYVPALSCIFLMWHTCVAQQFQFIGIDCYNVGMVSLSRKLALVSLGIPYQDGRPTYVETHYEDDVILYRTTWLIDGRRVVGEWKLAGKFIPQSDRNFDAQYNLCLVFDTMNGTMKVGTELKLLTPQEPQFDTETLIKLGKSQLDDQRFWR